MGKSQHAVPRNGYWAVRGAGNKKVTSVHDSQSEAIEAAREIARKHRSEIVICLRDGRIQTKDSYGSAPFPQVLTAVTSLDSAAALGRCIGWRDIAAR